MQYPVLSSRQNLFVRKVYNRLCRLDFLGLLVALNEQFSRTIWTIRTSTLTGRVWGFKTFLALKDCFFVVKPLNESKSRWMRLC